MKNLLFTFMLLSVSLLAIGQNNNLDDLVNTLESGKMSVIGTMLADQVDLIILDDERTASKGDAAAQINSFFRRNPLSKIEILHQGNKENSSFIISKYSSGDQKFRLYLLLKKNGEKSAISQVRIEKTFE